MGMGLYLSKIIIERYQGSIDIDYANNTNYVKVFLPKKSIIFSK
jgi:sensor histidine kinase regulating citrate/malate metabolism